MPTIRVGRDLRTAIGSAEYRPGVREKLDRVRSELDDWVQVEYDRQELDMERFSAMYYGALARAFQAAADSCRAISSAGGDRTDPRTTRATLP
jgi:hypothetical protein